MNREEIEQKLVNRAFEDNEFKEQLLNNPKAIFEKELGESISEDIEIKVAGDAFEITYISIPEDSKELSDEELDNVAGGGIFKRVKRFFKAGGRIVKDSYDTVTHPKDFGEDVLDEIKWTFKL